MTATVLTPFPDQPELEYRLSYCSQCFQMKNFVGPTGGPYRCGRCQVEHIFCPDCHTDLGEAPLDPSALQDHVHRTAIEAREF